MSDFANPNFLVEYLLKIPGLGRKSAWRMADKLRHWRAWEGLSEAAILKSFPFLSQNARQALVAAKRGRISFSPSANFVSFLDPRYPPRLRQLYDPPCGLYYGGDWEVFREGALWIAMVGTRRASSYALSHCGQIIRKMKDFKPVIVSGMALGIDGMAHRSALAQELKTVGVLGSSVDEIYPMRHRELAKEVARQGLLLSEYPAGTAPEHWHFPERNRLIAALSDVVVIIEAPEKSGALITADFALELGREVYVVPGPADSDRNRGGHRWIQQGAKLLMDAEEIFLDRGWAGPKENCGNVRGASVGEAAGSGSTMPAGLGDSERKLLEMIDFEALHIDKMVDMSHLPTPRVLGILMQLSLRGLVEELPGAVFRRKP
ncbi:MAG: DNA-processing protein DprA [Deltaproteobacteria bacterium]|nr:DNA-processing protein DprA [Deltaproteobacteria bacterium]